MPWFLLLLVGCTPEEPDDDDDGPNAATEALDVHLRAFADARFPDALDFTIGAHRVLDAGADPEALADEFVADAWSIDDATLVPWFGDSTAFAADVVQPLLVDGATFARVDWTLGDQQATTWAIVAPEVPATGDPIGFYELITSTWRASVAAQGLVAAFEDGWGTVRARTDGGIACSPEATCSIALTASDEVPGCGAEATAAASCVPEGGCLADVTLVGWCGGATGFGHVWADVVLAPTLSCGCGVHEDFDGDDLTPLEGDCDDGEEDTFPGAAESCDVVDSDCDTSLVDTFSNFDGDALPDCVDPDDDDDGDPDLTDCSGLDTAFHAGATEACDATDHDCDGSLVDTFPDTNSDLDPDCTDPDDDGDGEIDGTDCDDTNPAILHGATEACDAIDSNCDGSLVDTFLNFDGDSEPDCVDGNDDNDPDPDATDCDDKNNDVYNGAPEVCDSADDDCDNSTTDGCWVLVPNDTVLTVARGGTDGTTFTADCPSGQVIVGMIGRSGTLIDAMGVQCAPIAGNGTIGGYAPTSLYGGAGGGAFSGICTGNRMVAGISVRSGTAIDRVGGNCTLPDQTSPVAIGPWGGTGGTAFTDACPSGYVATGLLGRSDTILKQVRLRCTRINKT